MPIMSEPAKRDRGRPAKRERAGVPLHVFIDPLIDDVLKQYLLQTDPQITKTAYIESLIRADLRQRGLWPPPAEAPPASDQPS